MKRIFVIIAALFVFAVASVGAAFAAEPIEARIERVSAKLPDVKAYIYAQNTGALTAQDISATLDGKPLAVEEVTPFAASGEGTAYIFLIDVSTSITNLQMKAVQDALSAFSDGLQGKDKMVLLSFGMRVETLLAGGEDKAARENAINMLINNQDGTAFYDAINKAILIAGGASDALPERAVAIAISDGEEYNDGGYTKQEIDSALAEGSLPLFAVGLSEAITGDNTALDNFGETARTSGGGMIVAGAAGVGEALTDTVAAINDCYVVYLQSENNVIDAERQLLSINVTEGGRSATIDKVVWIRDWIPDTTPPEVVSVTQLEGQYGIRIEFSKPLVGADDVAAYTVTAKNGALVALQNAVYTEKADTIITEILFAEQLYTGDYTVSYSGITDRTMEKNELAGSDTFAYEGEAASLKVTRTIFNNYWWVVFIAAIAVVIFIVFRMIRKRKGLVKVDGKISFGEAVEFKHRFKTPETSKASLIVTDMKGETHRVDLEINKSLFVGRANSNNLSFDDTKMSRQHFAIEVQNGEYYISDLKTTNGTFLNGVKVAGKRKLENNDVITAGNEKFVFKVGESA